MLLALLLLGQPVEVLAGEDLTRWRALETRQDVALEDYEAFVDDFPTSPLAELAYRRLVEAGQAPRHVKLERSLTGHELVLSRHATSTGIIALDPYEVAPETPPPSPWHLWVTMAAGWTRTAHAGLGLRVSNGPVAGAARLQRGDVFRGEFAVLVDLPGRFLVEGAVDTEGHVIGRTGLRLALDKNVHLQLAAGIAGHRKGVRPTVRLELAQMAF